MDVTAIYNKISEEHVVFEEILPKSSSRSSITTFDSCQEKPSIQSDALLAVKLDPAVLEAQVTIDNGENGNNERSSKVSTETENHMKRQKKKGEASNHEEFQKAMCLQRAALFSLSSQQFSLLMKYVDTLRQQRLSQQKYLECGFCKNNGQPEVWYTTHALKDGKGRVRCPILRAFSCRLCGATGDNAHTIKYCPRR